MIPYDYEESEAAQVDAEAGWTAARAAEARWMDGQRHIVILEAQLAEAHRALLRYGTHFNDCNNAYRVPDYEPQNCSCGLAAAFSAPAIARVAEEDQLRREVCEAALALDDAEVAYVTADCRAQPLQRAQERYFTALDRLRAAREKGEGNAEG